MSNKASSSGIGGDPAGEGPYDFFVSYVPADQEWAEWIAWELEKHVQLDGRRPKVFIRAWNVVPGMNEVFSIDRALGTSARLLPVLTSEYLRSASDGSVEWMTIWLDDPDGRKRRMVPIRVGDCQPQGFLALVRPIDLVGQSEDEAVNKLRSGIDAALRGRARPALSPAFPGLAVWTGDPETGPQFPGPPALVGVPPTVPPKWFQDRNIEVEDIEWHLSDDRIGLVVVAGKVGLGKTAMIHRLWERIREGRSAVRVYGLLYLSARGFSPVNADRVIDDLIELFPRHEADQLRTLVREPLTLADKLAVLLDALAGRRVIIAIDAVEEVLDADQDIADTALQELVDYLVPRVERGVRLLLIGRFAPRGLTERFPGAVHQRNLDEGLPVNEAFALLQAMDVDRKLSLEAVEHHDKTRLHRLAGGSPRALELAYGLLAPGHMSFAQLLEFLGRANGEDVVVRLLALACERLSVQEQRVLQALAVYGRPVDLTAVRHLVEKVLPDVACHAELERLRGLRLVQSDGVSFSVPAPRERDFLSGLFGDESQETLLRLAADHFAHLKEPEARSLAELRPQLIEIELRLRAGDHRIAFELMRTVNDKHLMRWGASSALESFLVKLLRVRGLERNLEIDAWSMRAGALMQREDHEAAARHLEEALKLASGRRRIVLRKQLTAAYVRTGHLRHATVHSRRACREALVPTRLWDVATSLAGLAMCRAKEGRFEPALWLLRVARATLKLVGGERAQIQLAVVLTEEAWIHGQLGDRERARRLLREGRLRANDLGDRKLVGTCLLGTAQLALDDRDPKQAAELAEEAWRIGISNGNSALRRFSMEILAIAQLDQGNVDAAARAADIAQRNHGSVLGLGLVGLAAYRCGAEEPARAAFLKGYRAATKPDLANEGDFQFLDSYGLVTCGLVLLGDLSLLGEAVSAFRHARDYAPASGAVDRILLLLKQFGPDADPEILGRIRSAARGEGAGRLR